MSDVPPWLGDPGSRGLGRFIDHTLLAPEATSERIGRLCDEAAALGVKAVCVNGGWVTECARRLAATEVIVAAVVGFPLGAMATKTKADETARAVDDGAAEIDMVIALGRLLGGDVGVVRQDIQAVVAAAGAAAVKVILETAALDGNRIDLACAVAQDAGAKLVKTSTGFYPLGGATTEAVARMRGAVGSRLGVKASGGIRTCDAALAMLAAGADRLGLSATASLGRLLGPNAPTLGELFAEASTPAERSAV